MAGQEGNATRERMASVAKQEKWEVEYSRFLNLPPPEAAEAATAACPHLRSRRITKAGQESGGTWLTASASADLKLIVDWCNGDVIMRVEYLGRALEEHFISKQIFSWPQVSCEAGFAPRGTRVVMVTYRDEMEEVQKFAFQFLSICSLETFLNALKVYMENARSTMHFNYKNRSDVSSPQVYRPKMDLDSRTPLRSLSPRLPFSSNCEFGQSACPQARDRYSRGLTQSPDIINKRSFTSGKSYQQAVVEVSRTSSSQKPVHGNMRKSSADSSRSKRKSRHATTTAGITADGVPNKEIHAGAQEKENADPQRKMLRFEDSSHSGNKATESGTEQGIEQYLGQPISWHRSTATFTQDNSHSRLGTDEASDNQYLEVSNSDTELTLGQLHDEASNNDNNALAAFPPSFTSLTSSCFSRATEKAAATQLAKTEEDDLKSQIARYMEDSSFRDMLMKVEKVINDLGYVDGLEG